MKYSTKVCCRENKEQLNKKIGKRDTDIIQNVWPNVGHFVENF